jgi:hypothetical protein
MANTALIFVGGVSRTEKSRLIRMVCTPPTYHHVQISGHYENAIWPDDVGRPDRLRSVEWKLFEPKAIESLCNEVRPLVEGPGQAPGAVVINTHFASRSGRGFMAGTDPGGIEQICSAMQLLEEGSAARAGVILIDGSPTAIADRIRGDGMLGTLNEQRDVEDDLTQNRSISRDYYHTLVGLIGYQRTRYESLLIDFSQNPKSIESEMLKHRQQFEICLTNVMKGVRS